MNIIEIQKAMRKLVKEKVFLIENMDITGGNRGMRNNNRVWQRVKKIDKETKLLNKKLFNL
jgi:hypothetical protein